MKRRMAVARWCGGVFSACLTALAAGFGAHAGAQGLEAPAAAPSAAGQALTSEEKNRRVVASPLGACFRSPPPYPRVAQREGQQGLTLLSFDVNASGIAERPAVVRSSGFALLDKAALEHLAFCLSHTAAQDQGPLPPGRYAVPMVWRLE